MWAENREPIWMNHVVVIKKHLPWVFVVKCPHLQTTQFYVHWKWYWNNCNKIYIQFFVWVFFFPLIKSKYDWLVTSIRPSICCRTPFTPIIRCLGKWIFFSISGFTKLNIDKKYNFIWYYPLIVKIFRTVDEMESSHSSLVLCF